MAKIAILTATRVEFNTVSRVLPNPCKVRVGGRACVESHIPPNYVLLTQTGIGPKRSKAATRQLLEDQGWDLVISTGFAGGLTPLPVGALVIGKEVSESQGLSFVATAKGVPISCHPFWVQHSQRIYSTHNESPSIARFISVQRVLTLAKDKQVLGFETGAEAVDMESASIGQMALQHQVPFLIVRSISDTVSEDLPLDFNDFLRPSRWIFGLGQVVASPSSWKGFVRLYRNSRQASVTISNFFSTFFRSLESLTYSPGMLAEG